MAEQRASLGPRTTEGGNCSESCSRATQSVWAVKRQQWDVLVALIEKSRDRQIPGDLSTEENEYISEISYCPVFDELH